jgi:hypothetical protein
VLGNFQNIVDLDPEAIARGYECLLWSEVTARPDRPVVAEK